MSTKVPTMHPDLHEGDAVYLGKFGDDGTHVGVNGNGMVYAAGVIVPRADFLAAVAAECDVIVIPRTDLPPVKTYPDGVASVGHLGVSLRRESWSEIRGKRHPSERAATMRRRALDYLAAAEYLDAHLARGRGAGRGADGVAPRRAQRGDRRRLAPDRHAPRRGRMDGAAAMSADPGTYDVTPPDVDDYADDQRIERDQEIRVLGAPADFLQPGEFEAARVAAVERNRARRGVFASVPHKTAVDMVSAAIGHVEYCPQYGSADHALTVGAADRRIADAVRALRVAELNGLTVESDEWARLMGAVRDRTDEAMRTGLMGGDAA